MNETKKYALTGLQHWMFETTGNGEGMLWQTRQSTGFKVTTDMQPSEIAERVKLIVRESTFAPDNALIAAAGEAILKINWQAMLLPQAAMLTAPLLDAPTNRQASIVDMPKTLAAMDELEAAYNVFRQALRSECEL